MKLFFRLTLLAIACMLRLNSLYATPNEYKGILMLPVAGKGVEKKDAKLISKKIQIHITDLSDRYSFSAAPEDLLKIARDRQLIGIETEQFINEIGNTHKESELIMPCRLDKIGNKRKFSYTVSCIIYHRKRKGNKYVWETLAKTGITKYGKTIEELIDKLAESNGSILSKIDKESKITEKKECSQITDSFFNLSMYQDCNNITNNQRKKKCMDSEINRFCYQKYSRDNKCFKHCQGSSLYLVHQKMGEDIIQSNKNKIIDCSSKGVGSFYDYKKKKCSYKNPIKIKKKNCKTFGKGYGWNPSQNKCLYKYANEEKECNEKNSRYWSRIKSQCLRHECRPFHKWDRFKKRCIYEKIKEKSDCLENSKKIWKNHECVDRPISRIECINMGKKYINGRCITWQDYCEQKGKVYSSEYMACVPNQRYCEDKGKKYENRECVPIPKKTEYNPPDSDKNNSLAVLASIAVPGLGHMIKAPNPKGFIYSLFWMGWAGSTYNNFRMYSNAYNDAKKQYNSPLWGNHSIARDVILYEFLYQEYKRNGDSAKRSGINFIAIYFMSILTTNWTSSDSRFFASSRQKDNNHRFFTLDIYQKPVSSLSDFWSSKVEQYYNLQFNKNF